jgi:hypothetical protein
MPGFEITPATGFPPQTPQEFPLGLQFQNGGVNLGGRDADTVNFSTGTTATRGTGTSSNIITVTAEGGGGGDRTWRTLEDGGDVLETDRNNAIAWTSNDSASLVVPSGLFDDAGGGDVMFYQGGSGYLFVGGDGGTNVEYRSGLGPALRGPHAVAFLRWLSPNNYVLYGDLTNPV